MKWTISPSGNSQSSERQLSNILLQINYSSVSGAMRENYRVGCRRDYGRGAGRVGGEDEEAGPI